MMDEFLLCNHVVGLLGRYDTWIWPLYPLTQSRTYYLSACSCAACLPGVRSNCDLYELAAVQNLM